MVDDHDFRELVAGWLNHDRRAWDITWPEARDVMCRAAAKYLAQQGLRGDVEPMDVCQSVMAHLVQFPPRQVFECEQELWNYLTKAVEHQVQDLRRRQSAQRRDKARVDSTSVEEHDLLGNDDCPPQEAILSELRGLIRQSMNAEEWQVWEWRDRGRSWRDIGLRLARTADAVRIQFDRTLHRVRGELGYLD